jgi:4-aminobutyrate aminotransferase-like enzyme
MQSALDRLDGRLAAAFLDTAFTSDGIFFPPVEEAAAVVDQTYSAGGLFVADKVQAGHGRTGVMWCFENYGITPDVVTLGKPMGNGYPVAAVITRREIADELAKQTKVFRTFGGDPVAAAAALAVLDVIEDERLVDHVARLGDALMAALERVRDLGIVEVRSRGLLVGVELAGITLAERVGSDLRAEGILICRTSCQENVLKNRPPVILHDEHVAKLSDALTTTLASILPATN